MRQLVVPGLFLILLGLGCVSLEINHVQHADGSADITQTADISALMQSAAGAGDTEVEELCGQYEEGIDCTYEDGVLTLSRHFDADEAFYDFEVEDRFFIKRYTLTVDKIEELGTRTTSDENALGALGGMQGADALMPSGGTRLSSSQSRAMGSMLAAAGVDYTYIIEMPGNIVSAEGATETEGNAATFDLLERLQEGEPIVVVSEELNLILIAAVGGIGLLAVIGIVFFLVKRR
ncbi:MAG TPA: hypothetical protein VJH24_01065 [Candidatus Bilamarchaeaceae archaeon]|nr:hypothetical protein [Candidatus Bilamarchaeaceae archaeon]